MGTKKCILRVNYRYSMREIRIQLHRLANFIGILGVFKDFFGDEAKLAKIYRVLMGGLIAYIIGRTAYMTYKVFKNGYVKEIQRRVDDDNEESGNGYEDRPSLDFEPEDDEEDTEGEYGY